MNAATWSMAYLAYSPSANRVRPCKSSSASSMVPLVAWSFNSFIARPMPGGMGSICIASLGISARSRTMLSRLPGVPNGEKPKRRIESRT